MRRLFIRISILFIFSILSLNLSAQYGPQIENSGFENWTSRDENSVSEPVHWHSGGTASGSFSGMVSSQIEQSTHPRPGSSGSMSVRLYPTSIIGIIANGNITNGRMNAGSLTVTGTGNYNYTQRSQSAFSTPIAQLPDSLTVWVCFRSQSETDKAQVKAVVHGDADYKLIANGTEDPADMHVATAELSFSRTAPNGGAYNWRRLSIPFNNSGPCTDVRYILMTATTNETPGTGSTSDDLFVDDVLLVYNPTLTMGQLTTNQFHANDPITIPFTLSGTMSPDNLNASANQVIAELSDANGSFSNPTVLGSVTTNTSGSISATIPNLSDGQYQLRVRSTNYPMIGQNIQTLSITSPVQTYIVSVSANPTNGGTVAGGGSFTEGSSCTVTATANTNYTFANWTENGNVVSTSASYTFTVNGNRSLVANFTYVPPTYTVSVSANPSNGGTVSGGGTYSDGQECTVIATSANGYTFVNWTENGNPVSSEPSYTFTVTGNRTLVANFNINTYFITAWSDPIEGGTVTGDGAYEYGDLCTLTATANENYEFVNWTKDDDIVVSTTPSFTFVVNEAAVAAYVAHFRFYDNVDEVNATSQIFPNPFVSTLSVRTTTTVKSVSILDLYGRLVKEQVIEGNVIDLDLSDLSDGTYLIQLDFGNCTSVNRIVKIAQ